MLCSPSSQNRSYCGPDSHQAVMLTFVLDLHLGEKNPWSSAAVLVLWRSLSCGGPDPVVVPHPCPAAGRHRSPCCAGQGAPCTQDHAQHPAQLVLGGSSMPTPPAFHCLSFPPLQAWHFINPTPKPHWHEAAGCCSRGLTQLATLELLGMDTVTQRQIFETSRGTARWRGPGLFLSIGADLTQ